MVGWGALLGAAGALLGAMVGTGTVGAKTALVGGGYAPVPAVGRAVGRIGANVGSAVGALPALPADVGSVLAVSALVGSDATAIAVGAFCGSFGPGYGRVPWVGAICGVANAALVLRGVITAIPAGVRAAGVRAASAIPVGFAATCDPGASIEKITASATAASRNSTAAARMRFSGLRLIVMLRFDGSSGGSFGSTQCSLHMVAGFSDWRTSQTASYHSQEARAIACPIG